MQFDLLKIYNLPKLAIIFLQIKKNCILREDLIIYSLTILL